MTEEKQEVLTEVTTVAQENLKGADIKIPSPEELVTRASTNFFQNYQAFNRIFAKLSTKAKLRCVAAVLDIPTEGIPVLLQTDEERAAFAAGQNAINMRFVLLQHHINEQLKQKQEEQKKEQTNE